MPAGSMKQPRSAISAEQVSASPQTQTFVDWRPSKLVFRQLSGLFRKLKTRQEVGITRRPTDISFLDALRLVGTAKLRPLRLALSQGLLLIRNAFFARFIQTCTKVKCLGAIEAASPRDIELGYPVSHGHNELRTQHNHRKWNQHLVPQVKRGFSSPSLLHVACQTGSRGSGRPS